MTASRTSIQDFATANPVYANSTVTAYTVVGGAKTTVKANLYTSSSGATLAANPQTLDSFGKFAQPVYIQDAVILTATGLGNTPDHDTGITAPIPLLSGAGSPAGVITADIGTLYLRTDGGAGTTLYVKESGSGTNAGWVAK